MIINDLMKQKGISKYKLSQLTNIPYMTINDLCNGKTNYRKCSAENIYKIAQILEVTVEYLMEYREEVRADYDLFKSDVCHMLKEMGDIDFIVFMLEKDYIRRYAQKQWWPECLYLLAMLDYLSRINDIALVKEYNDLRKCKLDKIIYPSSVLALDYVLKNQNIKQKAFDESIEEFKRFNIVESEIRNVV